VTALAEAAGRLVVDRDETMFGEAGAAWFSRDRAYRYLLTRRWGDPAPWMTWIMLNPSKAGAFESDPTCTRAIGFAKREGCGGMDILNAFALIATDPKELRSHADPVGPDNDLFLAQHAAQATFAVAAWGVHGTLRGRGAQVARLLADAGVKLLCLGSTEGGDPRHPLYVRSDAPLVPWQVPS
jgi:hypothetical protein